MPCLGDPSHHTCCIVQSLAKCPGIPHNEQCPLLCPFWSHASLPIPLNHCVPCISVLCSRESSAASSTYLWSLPATLKIATLKRPLKLFCLTKLSYLIGRQLRTKALKRVPETASTASCSLVNNSCPLMEKIFKSSEYLSYSPARCATNVTTVGVFTLWNLSCKSFSVFASFPMVSFPTQSCLISMRFVASRVSAIWHHTLFRFSLIPATFFSYASFGTLWYFFSLLLVPLANVAESLRCSFVPSSDL